MHCLNNNDLHTMEKRIFNLDVSIPETLNLNLALLFAEKILHTKCFAFMGVEIFGLDT